MSSSAGPIGCLGCEVFEIYRVHGLHTLNLANIKYIGMASTTLSRRLTCHPSSGGPKQHVEHVHHECITRLIMTDNTKILRNLMILFDLV